MKLNLPKALTIAILAMSVGVAQASITSTTTTTEVTVKTDATYYGTYFSYKNGVVQINNANIKNEILQDFTFDLNYKAITAQAPLIYVGTADLPGTEGINNVSFGFYTTANGGITGAWDQGNTSGASGKLDPWTSKGTVSNAVFSGKDTDEDGIITLTAFFDKSSKGTHLAVGSTITSTSDINANDVTAETTGNIYGATGLRGSDTVDTKVTINTNYISNLYLKDVDATFTIDDYSVTKVAGSYIDATKTRVQLDGGDNGSAKAANEAGNTIYVGGTGQLFLQTWGAGAITLNNDIYLGSSTHGDVGTYGVMRFGNDGGTATTINGEIVVLEDTSMKAGGTQVINITGSVTDKKNIDGSVSEGGKTLTIGGKGYTFSGTVDVSNLNFAEGASAIFTQGFATGSLTLGNNVSLTSGTALTISKLIVGTGVTLNSGLTLSENATATMDGALTLGNNALTMGTLTLSGALMDALNGLTEGNTVNLFSGVSSLTLAGKGYESLSSTDNMDLSMFISGVDTNKYYLGYENNTVYAGFIAQAPPMDPTVPEPTTATLSLLTLAGLAARRRRK